MHTALAIALITALASLRNVVRLGDLLAGTATNPAAVLLSTIMFVLLAG